MLALLLLPVTVHVRWGLVRYVRWCGVWLHVEAPSFFFGPLRRPLPRAETEEVFATFQPQTQAF